MTATWTPQTKNSSTPTNVSKQYTAYDNGTAYVVGNQVLYLGSLYRCTASTTGNLPTDTNYWANLWANTSKS